MDADGGAGQGDPAGRARLARGVLGSLVDLDLRAAGVDGEDGGRGAREGADEQERSEDRTELLDGSLLHVVFSLCLALCGGEPVAIRQRGASSHGGGRTMGRVPVPTPW